MREFPLVSTRAIDSADVAMEHSRFDRLDEFVD
jgi:hypothetical protein